MGAGSGYSGGLVILLHLGWVPLPGARAAWRCFSSDSILALDPGPVGSSLDLVELHGDFRILVVLREGPVPLPVCQGLVDPVLLFPSVLGYYDELHAHVGVFYPCVLQGQGNRSIVFVPGHPPGYVVLGHGDFHDGPSSFFSVTSTPCSLDGVRGLWFCSRVTGLGQGGRWLPGYLPGRW